jgi:hypothetical protein
MKSSDFDKKCFSNPNQKKTTHLRAFTDCHKLHEIYNQNKNVESWYENLKNKNEDNRKTIKEKNNKNYSKNNEKIDFFKYKEEIKKSGVIEQSQKSINQSQISKSSSLSYQNRDGENASFRKITISEMKEKDIFLRYIDYAINALEQNNIQEDISEKSEQQKKFISDYSNYISSEKKIRKSVESISKEKSLKNIQKIYQKSQASFYTKRLQKYKDHLKNPNLTNNENNDSKERIFDEIKYLKEKNFELTKNYENILQLMNFMMSFTLKGNEQFSPQRLKNYKTLIDHNKKKEHLSFNYRTTNDEIGQIGSKKKCLKKKLKNIPPIILMI